MGGRGLDSAMESERIRSNCWNLLGTPGLRNVATSVFRQMSVVSAGNLRKIAEKLKSFQNI